MGRRLSLLLAAFALVLGCNHSRLGAVAESPTPTPTATATATPSSAIAFPQAIAGAMWANPSLYPSIPLRVWTAPQVAASSLSVTLDAAAPLAATGPDANGVWTVSLDISALADGAHTLDATAQGASGPVEAIA